MFNSPPPILFSLSFFTFYLRMKLDCQTKRDLNVNKCVSLFLFSFPTPRKKWLQLYKCTRRIRKREKCICGAISIDSTCTNDLKSSKEGSLWNLGVLNGIPQPPLPFEVRQIITSHCWIYSTTKEEEGGFILLDFFLNLTFYKTI